MDSNLDKRNFNDMDIEDDEELEKKDRVPDLDLFKTNKTDSMDIEKTNIDFEFYDPSEDQFHAMKALTTRFLWTISDATSDLSDVICKNAALGTMIGMADDEVEVTGTFTSKHVYAVLTILHVPTYKKNDFMKDVQNYVSNKSEKDNFESHQATFTKYQEDPKLGLQINERYLNLPAALTPMIHNQVIKDRVWAVENDKGFEVEYMFDYLQYVAKVQKEITVKKKKTQAMFGANDTDIIYYNYEDAAIREKAQICFYTEDKKEVQVSGEENIVTGRCIMIIKYSDYEKLVQKMK